MTSPSTVGRHARPIVLAAMIFAVSMTFIDQTIITIAVPQIQRQLGLSATGVQWAVNAYFLALASLFAFGGRLADTVGPRKTVTAGIVVFAAASALCGLTPTGTAAEAWLVAFRALQGAGGAVMFPAALAIVVQTFQLRERGRALALFFGIAGGLTCIGPIAGGYLTEWTWRAIFWVNIPVAAIALLLIAVSKPETIQTRTPIDIPGLVLIAGGVGLSIFGFQQSSMWGWADPVIGLCIGGGIALLLTFYFVELHRSSPLIQVRIFRTRPFLVESLVLAVASVVWIPVFFIASEYAQISLGENARSASLVLLYFFVGFAGAAQIGGRMLDRRGAKRPVVIGCVVAAIGFWLWANQLSDLHLGGQIGYIVLAGAGMGLVLGQANTDAINHASRFAYGEATGITQTVRNYTAGLGLAILGTVVVTELRHQETASLVAQGLTHKQAVAQAARISESQSAGTDRLVVPRFVRVDFAHASRTAFLLMAAIMAVAALIALIGLRPGRQPLSDETPTGARIREDTRVGGLLALDPAAQPARSPQPGMTLLHDQAREPAYRRHRDHRRGNRRTT